MGEAAFAAGAVCLRKALKGLRTVLLVTWSFYPIAYLFPILIADA